MSIPAAVIAGLIAGGAIAAQFGAVSAMLLETAVVAGPRRAVAAGLGVASVDFAYAALAVGVGAAARVVLAHHAAQLKVVAALALSFIAARGLLRIRQERPAPHTARSEPAHRLESRSLSARDQYVRFMALTAINPLTVLYFASVATSVSLGGVISRCAFAIGAGGASAAWHLLLTGAGGLAGRRLTARSLRAISIASKLVVLAIAARLAISA